MPTLRRILPLLAFLLAILSVADAQVPLRLQPVTPCRLVDTRSDHGGGGPILGETFQTFNLPQLASSGGSQNGCVPFSLSTAQAYSLNVTLVPVNNHPVGYLTIWPAGQAQPFVSLMNSDGRIKANAAIVPAGTGGGAVSVFVTDTTDVLIDIDAYFDPASDSSALAFFPLPPCRIVDTRGNQDGGTLQAMHERDYSIPGNCGIPSDAVAYSFNVTAIPPNGQQLYFLTVWPAGETQPVVSTLNDQTGTIVANAAIVPAGPQKKTAFWPYNNTDLLLDVNGYFAPANSASNPLSLFNVTPCRILDTRTGIGLFNGTLPVGIVGGACGIPGASDEAFVLNATVVPPGPMLYLQLWPEGGTQQGSTLNAEDGAITSNMAIVPAGIGNDSINAFAFANTQLILDASAYFAPIPALSIPESTLPDGVMNQGYSVPLVATGGVPPYTWTNPGGGLPNGITLTSGTLHGTPTTTGTYNFGVQVTDSNTPPGMANANLQITVSATQSTLAFTTTSLPDGTLNTPYNAVLSANGGITPYTFSIVLGLLPPGLILNPSTGQISGIPQAPGLSTMTVKVTDAQQHTAMTPLSIVVNTGSANGTLNGSYAFTFAGYNQSNWLVIAGSFTTDGRGGIVSGELDLNAPSGVRHRQITSGSYSIQSDGLGTITLSDNGDSFEFLIATGAAEDMRIIDFNQFGANGLWGAGVVRQQNPSDFHLAALAGTWTFGFQGFQSGNAQAGAGLYHQSASGSVTGQEDINMGGQESTVPFSGSASAPDSNGRATLQLQFGQQVLNYAAYLVSSNEFLVTEIDSGGALVTATSLRQSGTLNNGILHGKAIGRESRQKNNSGTNVSEADVALLSFDGAGNYSLTEDSNIDGTVTLQQMSSGTYAVNSTTGRTTINSSGGGSICYPAQQNAGFCIEATSGHPGLLYFQGQATNQQFNNAYLASQFLGGSLPQYVATTGSSIDATYFDGNGNFSFTGTETGPFNPIQQSGSGTYAVQTNGRVILSQNSIPIAYGYVVGPGMYEMISADNNPRLLIRVKSSAP